MIAQDCVLVSWVCMKYFHLRFLQVTTPPEAWGHVSKSAVHVAKGAPAVLPFFFFQVLLRPNLTWTLRAGFLAPARVLGG